MKQAEIRILAISGSLRKYSSNTAILQAASLLAPKTIKITLYDDIRHFMQFNPDLTGNEPDHILNFIHHLNQSDGVMFASPEYAHGIPGALKNALDWIVANRGLDNKPIALLNASIRATHAYKSLTEILNTIGAQIIPEASLVIPLKTNCISFAEIIDDPALSSIINEVIYKFYAAIKRR